MVRLLGSPIRLLLSDGASMLTAVNVAAAVLDDELATDDFAELNADEVFELVVADDIAAEELDTGG